MFLEYFGTVCASDGYVLGTKRLEKEIFRGSKHFISPSNMNTTEVVRFTVTIHIVKFRDSRI